LLKLIDAYPNIITKKQNRLQMSMFHEIYHCHVGPCSSIVDQEVTTNVPVWIVIVFTNNVSSCRSFFNFLGFRDGLFGFVVLSAGWDLINICEYIVFSEDQQ
jgi:hypothetical protein